MEEWACYQRRCHQTKELMLYLVGWNETKWGNKRNGSGSGNRNVNGTIIP